MKSTDLQTGLLTSQVQEQQQKGQTNHVTDKNTTSVTRILSKNLFTLFNFINLVIAILILFTRNYANLFFLGPVFGNFVIGSYQEIHAKKQLDKLTFLNRQKVNVLRDGSEQSIYQDELVLHDLIILQRGSQVPADGLVRQTAHLEVDESNITGESVAVNKTVNDQMYSGSIVTSGQGLIELTAVGDASFANRLAHSARKQEHNVSQLLNIINRIIKIVTYIIVPLGLLMFFTAWRTEHQINQAILGTAAAIIGMIPQGLVLLTSVALAVGALNLGRKKVLVKSMTALESLARVDTLCLDKTGTITTGDLKLAKILPQKISESELLTISQKIMLATKETNETARALLKNCKTKLADTDIQSIVPFSSERKWSAANFENRHFAIGAPSFLLKDPDIIQQAKAYAKEGLRVLAVVKSPTTIDKTIEQPEFLGLLVIQDEVRSTAQSTFEYLRTQGINIKIISGDDPITVQKIAKQVNIENSDTAVDMSTVDADASDEVFKKLANKYTIFGRTLPEQKQKLIAALQQSDHRVAMTGDGVNDVLAMRQSDCGVAIAGNSEAAESAADFVLLNKNFDSMIYVLNEGRRVINNIERVASLYLTKTMYSVILTVLFIMMQKGYPFHPSQMTPVNALTLGIPTFFVALRPDFSPPKGRFYRNVMQIALPAAIDITLIVILLSLMGKTLNLSYADTSTLSVLTICLIGYAALWTISRPIYRGIWVIFAMLFCLAMTFFTIFGKPFQLENVLQPSLLLYSLPLLLLFYPLFQLSRKTIIRIFSKKV